MTVTVLNEGRETEFEAEAGDALWLSKGQVARATGWELKPEGLCKGEVCVPLRGDDLVSGDVVNLSAVWAYMGKPVSHSQAGDAWSLGESAADRNNAMLSLEAPDFTLPDLAGNLHSLHDFRRKKVLLITWASW